MSSIDRFKQAENINILWDVLLDELNITSDNTALIQNIKNIFESNIAPFSKRNHRNLNILALNKQFLSQVVVAVNTLLPNLKQQQQMKRITISDEVIKEPYKIEDIHTSRKNAFDNELEQKRLDFETYVTPKKPNQLDFTDKTVEDNSRSMDSLLSEKMSQRNDEIELIYTNNQNSAINPEKWLTPQQTSNRATDTTEITKNETPELSKNTKKKVSWDDLHSQTDDTVQVNKTTDNSRTGNRNSGIFNKLKKTNIEAEQPKDYSNNTEIQYEQQQSMLLPEVKQEQIITEQANVPTISNEPIIPKTEIITQLNEMNNKIDKLYELVYTLVNITKTSQDDKIIAKVSDDNISCDDNEIVEQPEPTSQNE